jgi:hypothetical protein
MVHRTETADSRQPAASDARSCERDCTGRTAAPGVDQRIGCGILRAAGDEIVTEDHRAGSIFATVCEQWESAALQGAGQATRRVRRTGPVLEKRRRVPACWRRSGSASVVARHGRSSRGFIVPTGFR